MTYITTLLRQVINESIIELETRAKHYRDMDLGGYYDGKADAYERAIVVLKRKQTTCNQAIKDQ